MYGFACMDLWLSVCISRACLSVSMCENISVPVFVWPVWEYKSLYVHVGVCGCACLKMCMCVCLCVCVRVRVSYFCLCICGRVLVSAWRAMLIAINEPSCTQSPTPQKLGPGIRYFNGNCYFLDTNKPRPTIQPPSFSLNHKILGVKCQDCIFIPPLIKICILSLNNKVVLYLCK